MRMLLYKPQENPKEIDVDNSVEELSSVLGTEQYEWMTVRMLKLCVIHDPAAKDRGRAINRTLGTTPLYGDFLVCGIDWSDDGTTWATEITDPQIGLLKSIIFNKFPASDNPTE